MRLIDADYVTEKLNEINGTAELDKAFEVVENAPTVDVLEQIRAEIEALPRELPTDARNMVRRTRVLDIIDRHMKGADK